MRTSPARDPRGLSHARTSFVGRSDAVDKVAGLLSQYRLVTVTGPGGVGKTRLAGEVLRRVAGRFADCVWVAELAAATEPAHVPAMVATVLGLHQAADFTRRASSHPCMISPGNPLTGSSAAG